MEEVEKTQAVDQSEKKGGDGEGGGAKTGSKKDPSKSNIAKDPEPQPTPVEASPAGTEAVGMSQAPVPKVAQEKGQGAPDEYVKMDGIERTGLATAPHAEAAKEEPKPKAAETGGGAKKEEVKESPYAQVNFAMFNPFVPVRRPRYIRRACKIGTTVLFLLRDICQIVLVYFAVTYLIFTSNTSSSFSGHVDSKFMGTEEGKGVALVSSTIHASHISICISAALTLASFLTSTFMIYAVLKEEDTYLKIALGMISFWLVVTLANAAAGTYILITLFLADGGRMAKLEAATAIAFHDRHTANHIQSTFHCCGLKGPEWSYCSSASGLDGALVATLMEHHDLPGIARDARSRACAFAGLDKSCNNFGEKGGVDVSLIQKLAEEAVKNGKLTLLMDGNALARLLYQGAAERKATAADAVAQAWRRIQYALDSVPDRPSGKIWDDALRLLRSLADGGSCVVPCDCCKDSKCPGSVLYRDHYVTHNVFNQSELTDAVRSNGCMEELRKWLGGFGTVATAILWVVFCCHVAELILLSFQYQTIHDAYKGNKQDAESDRDSTTVPPTPKE